MKNRACRPRKQLPRNSKKCKEKQRKIHICPSEEEEEEDPLEDPYSPPWKKPETS
jgi:hypothetical protein